MKKKSKPSTDVNVTAFEILQAAEPRMTASVKKAMEKSPVAAALGRLKCEKARADKLSAKKRSEIA